MITILYIPKWKCKAWHLCVFLLFICCFFMASSTISQSWLSAWRKATATVMFLTSPCCHIPQKTRTCYFWHKRILLEKKKGFADISYRSCSLTLVWFYFQSLFVKFLPLAVLLCFIWHLLLKVCEVAILPC